MTKGRIVPPSKESERRAALLALDIPAMRAWAVKYAVGLLGDDRTVLISMHETRIVDPKSTKKQREESVAWLGQEFPDSTALRQHYGALIEKIRTAARNQMERAIARERLQGEKGSADGRI